MSKDESRITEGARLLRAYIKQIGSSVPVFCELHKLDRIQVQRVLNGERWARITVDFAASIERATDGKITWRSFLSRTARVIKKAA